MIDFFFSRKTLIVVSNEAVLTSTHNLCFRAKLRKNVYPGKPQCFYIKWGVRGSLLHGHVFVMVRSSEALKETAKEMKMADSVQLG